MVWLAAWANSLHPLAAAGFIVALFMAALTPYVLAACGTLPAAFPGSLLGGLTAGAFVGSPGGFWLWRRVAPAMASA